MTELKGLIFDLDGTMIDNMDFHMQAWYRFFTRHQLDTTHYQAQIHGTNSEILPRIFNKPLTPSEIKGLAYEKESLYRDLYLPHIQPIAGLGHFLAEALEMEVPLGLATMSGQENIAFSLQNLGFQDYFKVITGAHMVQNGKPDPEVFNKTIQGMGITPVECVIFEDSKTGIQGAKAAGAKVVGVTSGHSAEDLKSWGADLVIQHYREINVKKCIELINHHQDTTKHR